MRCLLTRVSSVKADHKSMLLATQRDGRHDAYVVGDSSEIDLKGSCIESLADDTNLLWQEVASDVYILHRESGYPDSSWALQQLLDTPHVNQEPHELNWQVSLVVC